MGRRLRILASTTSPSAAVAPSFSRGAEIAVSVNALMVAVAFALVFVLPRHLERESA